MYSIKTVTTKCLDLTTDIYPKLLTNISNGTIILHCVEFYIQRFVQIISALHH